MSITSSPAIRPASFVAFRRVSSKYAGTVITACLIGPTRNSASCASFFRMIADSVLCGGIRAGNGSAVRRLADAALDQAGDALRVLQRDIEGSLADDHRILGEKHRWA